MAEIIAEVRGDKKVVADIRNLTPALRMRLMPAMDEVALDTETYIKMNKLSGNPLHRRTGKLSNAQHWRRDDTPVSVIRTIFTGKEAFYGFIHEYGGTFTVPAHQRTQTKVWGRPVTPFIVNVRAHTATYPERSYARSSLREKARDFFAAVRRAIRGIQLGER